MQLGLESPRSALLNKGALGSMFIAVNFEAEDELSQAENEENDNLALMRFEWLEIVVRAASVKYMQESPVASNIAAAVQLFCDECLTRLPAEALVDSNKFRKERLYTEKMNRLLLVGVHGCMLWECSPGQQRDAAADDLFPCPNRIPYFQLQ